MAAYNKVYQLVEDLSKKVHNLSTDALTIALGPLASSISSSFATLAQVSQIAYTNLSAVGLSARTPAISSCAQTSGTLKLVLADLTLTATSSPVAAFGNVVLFNDTAANDPLICWWSFLADVTLTTGDTFTLDFDQTGGVLTLN